MSHSKRIAILSFILFVSALIFYNASTELVNKSGRSPNVASSEAASEVKERFYRNDQEVVAVWHPFEKWTANPVSSSHKGSIVLRREYLCSFDQTAPQEYRTTIQKGSFLEIGSESDKDVFAAQLKARGIKLGTTGKATIAVVPEGDAKLSPIAYSVTPAIDIASGKEARPAIQILARREKFKVWKRGTDGLTFHEEITVDTYGDTPFRPLWEIRDIRTITPSYSASAALKRKNSMG